MTYQSFDTWLTKLKKAWETKDPKAAADLCATKVLYYETPFDKPLKTRKEVLKIWQEVPQSQKDITVKYSILSVTDKLGISQWSATFIRIPSQQKVHLEGIFSVSLNAKNLCKEFHQWWNVKS